VTAPIEFKLELGTWGMLAKRLPGASWRASFYDRVDQCHYAGSDDDPWLAIAWALDERERRRRGEHAMARNEGDRPGAR